MGNTKEKAYFGIKRFIVTDAAKRVCDEHQVSPITLLVRHMTGDWSETSPEDQRANRGAHFDWCRITTSYRVGDETITIVTNWRSEVTTVCVDGER